MLLFAVLLLSIYSVLGEGTDYIVDQKEILKVEGDVVGKEDLNYSETVDPDKRVECFPAPGTTQLESRCAKVGCIYDRWSEYGIPVCYFPRRSGYVKTNETADAVVLESYANVSNPYGENISPILFKYSKIGSTLNIRIGPERRYEPQLHLPRESYNTGEEIVVEQSNETGVFAFKVKRPSTNQNIWDTTIGGLMFSDQYIQIAAFIGTSEIYGIGEHAKYRLKHTWDKYETWPMFARDQFPSSDTSSENLYGAYPFYIGVEDDGKAHGVLILNSNAQEIMLGPAPHLAYRTIGGMLDIYFFPGPYPEDVVRQYTALVGKPAFPPYWAFGYQLCKYGYKSLAELNETISAVQEAGIPLDVIYADIDHMDLYQDFTLGQNWSELPTYIQQLHNQSMHAILIFDPAIQVDSESFRRGITANAKFVEWERDDQVPRANQDLYPLVSNTKIMLGTVWPLKHVAFPDFTAPETQEWWKNEIVRFHAQVGFDGMWIDMNEPTNIGTNENDTQPVTPNHSDRPYIAPLMCPLNGSDSKYDMPPYETYNVFVYEYDDEKSYLSSKTLCMLGMTDAGRIYDTKSLYGFYESIATRAGMEAATSKRPLVLTRSSFPSGGRYAGHWLGDNLAAWGDLRVSIVGIQDFSMFGIPYVGADICGFRGDTTEPLCLRWHQIGAFYSFSRNHNDIGQVRQDPAAWPTVAAAARKSYLFRYRYLPYLYTLHYLAATSGSTVIRPLFFEFPKDRLAGINDNELMWGEAMLIITTIDIFPEVYAYLPPDASWYSLRDTDYGNKTGPGFQFLSATTDEVLPVFIRGGYIIPRQAPEMTTIASRKNPLELVIALNEADEASGTLFWDDGESSITPNCCNIYQFKFRVRRTYAKLTVTGNSANRTVPPLNVIEIFGYYRTPDFRSAKVNNYPHSITYCASYDPVRKIISINCTNLLNITTVGKSITWSNKNSPSETIDSDKRIDCMPESTTSSPLTSCTQEGCVYDPNADYEQPSCYYPRKSGYVKKGVTSDSILLESHSAVSSPYGDNISPILFKYSRIGSTLNIRIGPEGRYEPPLNLPRESYDTGEELVLEQTTETGVFAFKVKRPSANESIWDTTIGGLMFADQFIQIAAYIGSSEIYGLGEHTRTSLRHTLDDYTTWAMFSRDQFPSSETSNKNLYGVYPFYIAIEDDHKAHGVLILNSNAQELTVGPAPHIVYRTIGGMLDIYFFPGPSPEDVVRQYAALVGKPALPPYWAFGYQLCKYGYKSLAELKETISAVQDAGIPLDVVYADIDHMDLYQDFTLGQNWTELPTYVKQLHDQSMHAILIFDPAIQVDSESFQRGIKANAKFVEWERDDQVPRANQDLYPLVSNTKIMLGTVWPLKHVAFPDFTAPETQEWWKNEIVRFHAQVGFDGMWIDMNEPTNIGTNENDTQPVTPNHTDRPYIAPLMCPLNGSNSKYDMPPYKTFNVLLYDRRTRPSYLSSKTLCMLGMTNAGRIYDTKSLYGLFESIATRAGMEAATSKRPAVITRSSFPSGGRYAGHWLGDNSAAWKDLLVSVVGIQEFSIFGIPYVGADICGFRGNTTEELCLRWHQLGAFYTFSRNHNDIGQVRQDPAAWPSVAAATRQVYLFRYRYLPYLYTLHYLAATTGSTVVRPLFFEFPNDDATHDYNKEFMWGDAMLIAPILQQRLYMIYVYLPREATWYSLRDTEYGVKSGPGFTFFSAPLNQLPPVFIRGGCIVPRQAPEMTTIASRKNPFELVIALNETDEASGTLFWDDGESPITPNCCSIYQFNFRVNSTSAVLTITGYSANITIPSLNVIDIFGYDKTPSFETAVINGLPRSLSDCASYDSTKRVVSINCTNLLDISSVGKSISWSNTYSETVDPNKRVECFPAPGTTQLASRCAQAGCIYDRLPEYGIPACYFPPKSGYVKKSTTSDGVMLENYQGVSNPYGNNISPILFKYSRIGSTLNIRIGPEGRYEPPLNLPRESYDTGEELFLEQTTETGVFAFKVKRASANESIWDTTIGGLMFADQYIQIAAFIGSSSIYGLGEHAKYQLMHTMDSYETWPMFSRDQFPSFSKSNQNLYGAYPFYIAVEKDYKAHGVLIVNSNAQELMIGPAPHIVYRTIGGMLDIYFFPGPYPEDVVRQYVALVGKPAFPPYWGFGYQLCKYGYKSLAELRETVSDVQEAGIPLDVVYADIDHMDLYQDFTLGQNWTELPTYIQQLHNQSMHAILIFDPAIQVDSESFRRGITANAKFVEWERDDQVPRANQDLYPLVSNTKIMLGTVWPLKHVAFPDFTAPETQEWWKNEIVRFHAQVGFDGMWIDMNEPTNIGTNENDTQPVTPNHSDRPYIAPLMCPLNGSDSKYDMPPYETYNVFVYEYDDEKSYLSSKTLCMLGMTNAGRIYDTKSLYGFYESIATRAGMEAATSKRPLVLTRSSFPSGGRYAGHWLGDNSATWEDLHESVIGIQDFSMFGIPYVGADICGFRGNTTEDLCLRWHQLGAFYTFSRNHNDIEQVRQDPAAWPSVAEATRQVYLFRYYYLPYLYTLHYFAATSGSTVVRPVFFEFPKDRIAYVVDGQFMWGEAMLITPALSESKEVYAYFPQEATWYSLRDIDYGMKTGPGSVFVSAALNQLPPVFIRGGHIIPRQAPEMTTIASRKNPLELVIAVNAKNESSGSLFWDDGESPITPNCCNIYQFNFRVNSTSAELTITGYSANITMPALNVIDIMGYSWVPMFGTAIVNGVPHSLLNCSTYDPVMHVVHINCTNLLDISSVGKSISWSNTYSEAVDPDKRVNCLPAPTTGSLVDRCTQLGCIYDYWADYGIPECYFPRRSGYIRRGTTTGGVKLESYSGVSNPYGDNISPIFFKYSKIGSAVNIRIGPEGRYEPPLSLPRESYETGEELVVEQSTETGVFAFKVKRPSANDSIWDTTIGGLMFADQYVQIAAFIGSSEIYGLGEHTRSRFRHTTNTYVTWPMFSRDQFPSSSTSNQNLYGVYPFYIAIENDHKAHGVLILNSNAQELTVGPAPHIVYRTIGGMLDIYFFPGPSPEDVVRQYAALVGKPALPPYWAFGYQLCKYGYKSLAELKETISAVQDAGIPLDVVYADIDHMDLYQDFTLGQNWTELPTYVKQLHDQSMHAILIFDPAIQVDSESFQRGIKANAKFVEWERDDQVPRANQDLYPLVSNTKIMLGTVWPLKHVAFPDFTAPETQEWWKNEIVRFHAQVGFDGMWIDMNEPTNIGTNENDTQPVTPNHSDRPYIAPLMCPLNGSDSKYDMPPYETYNVFVYEKGITKSYLSSKTLCMLGMTNAGRIYDTKSLYGLFESIATRAGMEAATSKRPAVIARSSFPSGGHYAGHWLGDNLATWGDLRVSVVGIQEFSIFAIPYVGADICGFRGNTTEELCLRWHQLGAFYTFSRNHNDIGQVRQDPAAWPSVAAATRQVYLFRYHYLPYLYTLHYLAATTGSTVVRPVFFEFPNDDAARENNEQFMWGDAMLIAPVLREQWEVVYAYLPREATWYSLRDTDYGVKAGTGFTFLNAPLDQLPPVLIRGGYIVPRQAPEVTTIASRENPLELVIAVSENDEASGSLFWDDGESPITSNCCNTYRFNLRINSTSTLLTITGYSAGLKVPTLNIIDIFGYSRVPYFENAVVNGAAYSLSRCARYDATKQIVSVNCPNLLDISNGGGSISWSNGAPMITTPTAESQTMTTSTGQTTLTTTRSTNIQQTTTSSSTRQTTLTTTRSTGIEQTTTTSSPAAVTTQETLGTTSRGMKIASNLMSALLLNYIAAVLLYRII